MTALLVVLTIIIAVAVDVLVVARRQRRAHIQVVEEVVPMTDPRVPQGIFLDRTHGWARITAEGTLRVGIDDLLAQAVGSVDGVEMPARGARIKRGDPLVTLKVRGRSLVVPSPVEGEVVSLNDQVVERPWLVTRDPYGIGWTVGLWARDLKEAIRPLRIGSGATAFLRDEMHRLMDFLSMPSHRPDAVPVLADGGVPRRGALSTLDEAGWDAFQNEFMSTARER